ncbi:MAG: ABC transporter permease [Terriglobales bacterium]
MNGLLQDLRYALRQLRSSPGFTAVAVLTLALGIGAATAIYSVVYGVLLRPLPYNKPDRITAIFEVNTEGRRSRLADPNFDDFRDQNRSFEAMAKYSAYPSSISGGSQPTRSVVGHVSSDFFTVFRVKPIIGRGLNAADDVKGAMPVAVVSYGYWKQYLWSSADLSRSHLKIDKGIYSIVGVLPPAFQFPANVELWIPADPQGENPSRSSHNYNAIGRLRDGVSVEQANAEISAIARRIHDAANEKGDFLLKDASVVPLRDAITGDARPALLMLLAAVVFLLLVACANVTNLRLAQGSVRERELAIRTALGAGRGRLVRQFVTEAVVLSFVGGGLGMLGAYFGVIGLLAVAPQDLPRLENVSIDLPVLIVAFLVCLAVGIALGVFTAMRATHGDVRDALTSGGHSQAGSRDSQRVGRGIVAAQMATTVVLVVGAGLLGRSLMKVLEVDPGFRVGKVITMDVSLPWPGWNDQKARSGEGIFFRNLIDRLKQVPGVRRVGATTGLPMDGGLPNGTFELMTQNQAPKTPKTLESLSRLFDAIFKDKQNIGEADFCAATDEYFQILGIPLIKGRIFSEHDAPNSQHVALISQSLARERWPGQNPLGQTIEFGNMDGDLRLLTVVGIVGDVHDYGLDVPPRPTIYVNLSQRPDPAITITMLTDADTGLVTPAARQILHELNPEVAPNFRTFSQIYSASLGSRRFNLILVGWFAAIALSLATAGAFGVMAYSVSRRTREIGVRVALGARSQDVLSMILVQGLRTALIGIVIGLVSALALTRAVESMLFGVKATDPLTFSAVILLLVTTALLACYLPARRAAKIDPMVALRYE